MNSPDQICPSDLKKNDVQINEDLSNLKSNTVANVGHKRPQLSHAQTQDAKQPGVELKQVRPARIEHMDVTTYVDENCVAKARREEFDQFRV